jgi:energy-coupling factor transporter ATP-binding protein EcfA2
MILRELRIQNFRSFVDETVRLDAVTALVGPNGAGKSNVLHALNFFYAQAYPLTALDFYNKATDESISVTLTFGDLTAQEREHFGTYVDGDVLSISKVASWASGSAVVRYHGSSLQCPDFAGIRAEAGDRDRKTVYNTLVDAGNHAGLAKVTRGGDVEAQLGAWEVANAGRCVRQRDQGQFFGWTNVGHGRIDEFSKWIFVPAVRDAASEATESRNNALKGLLDLFLRPKLESNTELQQLREDASRKYREILDPEHLQELKDLGEALTATLSQLAPETRVQLGWQKLDAVSFPLPTASTQLGEGNFLAPVEYAGHGTQRAFLIAILQHLVKARIRSGGDEQPVPHILLGIEEPELYLHPIRARLVNRVLRALSAAEPGRPAVQSIYGTHSPHFVDVPNFRSVRQVKRTRAADPALPGVSKVHQVDVEELAARLAVAHNKPRSDFSWDRLRPRLATVMTPMISEGFFADLAVLVEGEEDRAFIVGAAARQDIDLEARGIAVIPVCGKCSIDRPYVVFSGLGIRCFIVFDGDAHKSRGEAHVEINQALLRLCGESPEESPDTRCWANGACFKTTTGLVARDQIGPELYDRILAAVAAELGYPEPTQAAKNPIVIGEVLRRCAADGGLSPALEAIIDQLTPAPAPTGEREVAANATA